MSADRHSAAVWAPSVLGSARSFLFVPGHRPDRFVKALESGADAVILDLEDSVPHAAKVEARAAIGQQMHWLAQTAGDTGIAIRINSPETVLGQQDLVSLQGLPGLAGLVMPKCESASTLRNVAQTFPGLALLPIIESARGCLALAEIAQAPNVCRLVVGHVDFLADTGMVCSDDQRELDPLRFQVSLWSRHAELAPAVDGITVDIDNTALIRSDTERAIGFGFGGKLCIHPRQVEWVHEALRPSADQIDWAQRVLEAMASSNGSAIQLDGKMVDQPVVQQARQLLSRIR